jgi:hypothetical protein
VHGQTEKVGLPKYESVLWRNECSERRKRSSLFEIESEPNLPLRQVGVRGLGIVYQVMGVKRLEKKSARES